jgi:hypothetical protein
VNALRGMAFVTEVTAGGDGLTETVSDSHKLLIMVRLQFGGLNNGCLVECD